MRKRISMILIIAMMATVPAGCGSDDKSGSKNISTVSAEQTEEQTEESTNITLQDGEDVTIDTEGVYVVSGTAANATIYVEAGDEDKVQIVLDGVSMTNEAKPCIYVKSGDKVIVSTTDKESNLSVTGTFEADGDTNLDAVIFSKSDLELSGNGTLSIASSDNGISGKDSLKVTGGTINIDCSGKCLEANDEIEIDAGELELVGTECIEGTYIRINDGIINITASDDGINAAQESDKLSPTFEMNGGTVTITMGAGDTDGVDSNGDIYINGGTISISGQSSFDCDGTAEHNGGTIIVNGEETDEIPNQFMGGEGMEGPGGQGDFNPNGREGFGPGGQNGFGGERGPK